MALKLPQKKDEFQNSGFERLGEAIQRRLYAAGIDTYEKLACASFAELYQLVQDVPGYTLQNLEKWDWPAKARKRIPEQAPAASHGFIVQNSQRNATFTVELLLNPDDTVRRVRVTCIQDGETGSWSRWDEPELVEFIVQHADLDRASIESPSLASQGGIQPVPDALSKSPSDDLAEDMLENQFALLDLVASPAGSADARSHMPYGQKFDVQLALDLPERIAENGDTWTYRASVHAKMLGTDLWQDVAETWGIASQGGVLALQVPGTGLPRGLYRLDADASLKCEAKALHVETHERGGLLQVY